MIVVGNTNVKKCVRFGLSIILVGLMITAYFGYLFYSVENKKNNYDMTVEAYDIDVNCSIDKKSSASCKPIYSYVVDNKNLTCESKRSSDDVENIDKTVYYSSNVPTYCLTGFDSHGVQWYQYVMFAGLAVIAFGFLFILRAIYLIIKVNNLVKKGTLFKGVDFNMEESGISVNGASFLKPVVKFILPNGKEVELVGDIKYDNNYNVNRQKIDVLIDLKHPSNYYIDYNISASDDKSSRVLDYSLYLDDLAKKNIGQNNNEDKPL